MQLPHDDEIVMIAGMPPLRAKKVRYFLDRHLSSRILPPPDTQSRSRPPAAAIWTQHIDAAQHQASSRSEGSDDTDDGANSGIRQEPELPAHEDIVPEGKEANEFAFEDDNPDQDAGALQTAVDRQVAGNARSAALDPRDGIEL